MKSGEKGGLCRGSKSDVIYIGQRWIFPLRRKARTDLCPRFVYFVVKGHPFILFEFFYSPPRNIAFASISNRDNSNRFSPYFLLPRKLIYVRIAGRSSFDEDWNRGVSTRTQLDVAAISMQILDRLGRIDVRSPLWIPSFLPPLGGEEEGGKYPM